MFEDHYKNIVHDLEIFSKDTKTYHIVNLMQNDMKYWIKYLMIKIFSLKLLTVENIKYLVTDESEYEYG